MLYVYAVLRVFIYSYIVYIYTFVYNTTMHPGKLLHPTRTLLQLLSLIPLIPLLAFLTLLALLTLQNCLSLLPLLSITLTTPTPPNVTPTTPNYPIAVLLSRRLRHDQLHYPVCPSLRQGSTYPPHIRYRRT